MATPASSRRTRPAGRALRAAVLACAAAVVVVLATPFASAAAEVTSRGTAAGSLADGSTIRVKVHVTNSAGWQRIKSIVVSLRLRGQPLDQVVVVPSTFSISIVNSGPPVSIGEEGVLEGPYFKLNNAKVTVAAKENDFDLTFPIKLGAEPPTDAALFLDASDSSGVAAKQIALTPPVKKVEKGFPWGTIGLAAAAALFIGAFVGNTFSTRRARARPNVYATVSKRLSDDRARRIAGGMADR